MSDGAPLKPQAAWPFPTDNKRANAAKQFALDKGLYRLTRTEVRGWGDDTWTETVIDWQAVADLLDAWSAQHSQASTYMRAAIGPLTPKEQQ